MPFQDADYISYFFAAGSFVAAASSALAAWFVYKSSRRSAARMLRLEWTRDLLTWTDDAIAVLTKAHHLCWLEPSRTTNPSFFDRRIEILTEISTVVDRGRMFFVNTRIEGEVTDGKPKAYTGNSPQAIFLLTEAYRQTRAIDYADAVPNSEIQLNLLRIKRQFVSVMQNEIDPNWFRKAAVYESQSLEKKSTDEEVP